MSFKHLKLIEPLERALEKQGYVEPTPIQEKAILKEHLYEMALQEEIKEAEYWANNYSDPLLAIIPVKKRKIKTNSVSFDMKEDIKDIEPDDSGNFLKEITQGMSNMPTNL